MLIFQSIRKGDFVALKQSISVSLKYGHSGEFACELDSSRVAVFHPGPTPKANVAELVRSALASPLDLPPLDQALVPEDRVVIALDRTTPCAAEIVADIWTFLERRGIAPTQLSILQPPALEATPNIDPRTRLPPAVRAAVRWQTHDPTVETSCGYLATTNDGERMYLAQELLDADAVIPVGVTGFDSLLGYRGTSSVLYPGLSTIDAMRKTIGLGHSELAPGDVRPLRQLVDEVAWLMGIQFTVQVVASDNGGVSAVVAGSCDGVFRHCRDLVNDHWMVSMPERVETAVIAIPADSQGHGWSQIGQALATARQIVEPDGRIVILSELAEQPRDGVRLLSGFEDPHDALRPLQKAAPPDLVPATQLASAACWARLYLLSTLDSNIVESLFMYPIADIKEVERLLEQSETCALIGSAQHTFGLVD